jgi:hypothetical protein
MISCFRNLVLSLSVYFYIHTFPSISHLFYTNIVRQTMGEGEPITSLRQSAACDVGASVCTEEICSSSPAALLKQVHAVVISAL